MGQFLRSFSANSAHAVTTCSQLSRISSIRLFCKKATSVSAIVCPDCSRSRSAVASALGRRSGSRTGAMSTNHTPFVKRSTPSAAACRASRVLPLPPEPESVSKRVRDSNCLISASSVSRPIKLVSCSGRLWANALNERRSGNSLGSPGSRYWKICSGRTRSLSRCSPRSTRSAVKGR